MKYIVNLYDIYKVLVRTGFLLVTWWIPYTVEPEQYNIPGLLNEHLLWGVKRLGDGRKDLNKKVKSCIMLLAERIRRQHGTLVIAGRPDLSTLLTSGHRGRYLDEVLSVWKL